MAPDKDPIKDSGSDTYVETELYDLEHDPYELMNLIGEPSHDRVVKVMRERLLRRMKEAGEEVPVIIPAEKLNHRSQRVVFEGEEFL